MEKFVCQACVFLGGAVLGVAAGVILMQIRARPTAFAERCKARLEAVEAWPESDKAKFWADVESVPEWRAEWRVIKAAAAAVSP